MQGETTMTNSVRHLQTFTDTMGKYHGEIERLVYAAEVACPSSNRGAICHHKDRVCPFKALMWTGTDLHVCRLRGIRVLMGETVKQGDVMEERK
jgi:hypothetical protein